MTRRGIFYRITHLPTGRYYLGVTYEEKWNSGYMGSGVKWRKIVKAHPKSEFTREIVKTFSTHQEAFDFENETVTLQLIAEDKLCCNLQQGGLQYSHPGPEVLEKISKALKGKKHKKHVPWSDETREMFKTIRISQVTDDTRRKLREHAARMRDQGIHARDWHHTDDAKNKISKTLSSMFWWKKDGERSIRAVTPPDNTWIRGRK